jgi:hypothetical protein
VQAGLRDGHDVAATRDADASRLMIPDTVNECGTLPGASVR